MIDFHLFLLYLDALQRSYAFERTDIPAGKQYVLKINYPFKVHLHQYGAFLSPVQGLLFSFFFLSFFLFVFLNPSQLAYLKYTKTCLIDLIGFWLIQISLLPVFKASMQEVIPCLNLSIPMICS